MDDVFKLIGTNYKRRGGDPSTNIKPYIIVITDQAQCWSQQTSHKPNVRLDLRNPVRSRQTKDEEVHNIEQESSLVPGKTDTAQPQGNDKPQNPKYLQVRLVDPVSKRGA